MLIPMSGYIAGVFEFGYLPTALLASSSKQSLFHEPLELVDRYG